MNKACNHKWRRVYEDTIVGVLWHIAWDCIECKTYILQDQLTPIGLGGVILKGQRLRGPGECSDGSIYQDQITDENGVLTITRQVKK